MIKIQLTEQERKVYDMVVRTGTMEDMFKFAYTVGRTSLSRELLDELGTLEILKTSNPELLN